MTGRRGKGGGRVNLTPRGLPPSPPRPRLPVGDAPRPGLEPLLDHGLVLDRATGDDRLHPHRIARLHHEDVAPVLSRHHRLGRHGERVGIDMELELHGDELAGPEQAGAVGEFGLEPDGAGGGVHRVLQEGEHPVLERSVAGGGGPHRNPALAGVLLHVDQVALRQGEPHPDRPDLGDGHPGRAARSGPPPGAAARTGIRPWLAYFCTSTRSRSGRANRTRIGRIWLMVTRGVPPGRTTFPLRTRRLPVRPSIGERIEAYSRLSRADSTAARSASTAALAAAAADMAWSACSFVT